MNDSHSPDLDSDGDDQYRRLSAVDPSRPSTATRAAVLAHAEQLTWRRAPASRSSVRRWWPMSFGALAAAALVALSVAPRLIGPPRHVGGSPPSLAMSQPAPSSQAAPLPPHHAADLGEADELESRSTAASPPRRGRTAAPEGEQARREAGPSVGGHVSVAEATAPTNAVTPSFTNSDAVTGTLVSPAASSRDVASAAQRVTGVPALQQAARSGDLATIERLHASGADLDARDSQGRTAVLEAAMAGHGVVVERLLEYGANPNIADNDGRTPLAVVDARQLSDISSTLRRFGAH
jgi:hypothetical protein